MTLGPFFEGEEGVHWAGVGPILVEILAHESYLQKNFILEKYGRICVNY